MKGLFTYRGLRIRPYMLHIRKVFYVSLLLPILGTIGFFVFINRQAYLDVDVFYIVSTLVMIVSAFLLARLLQLYLEERFLIFKKIQRLWVLARFLKDFRYYYEKKTKKSKDKIWFPKIYLKQMDNVLVLNKIAALLEDLFDEEFDYLEKHYAISQKPSLPILKIIESYFDEGRPALDEDYYRRSMIDDLSYLSEFCFKIHKDFLSYDHDFISYMREMFLDSYEKYIPEEKNQELVTNLNKVFDLNSEIISKKKLRLNHFYQRNFDFKIAKYDNKYLLKLWSKLYYEDAVVQVKLDSKKRIAKNSQKKIYKISILDRYFFERLPISYEEVEVVKRGLSKRTLEELKVLEIYLQSTKVQNEVVESWRMVWLFLKKLNNLIVSFILVLGIFRYETVQELFKKVISSNSFWYLFIVFVIYSITIIYLYTGTSFMFSTKYKSQQIESIFPVILKDVLDDKKIEDRTFYD